MFQFTPASSNPTEAVSTGLDGAADQDTLDITAVAFVKSAMIQVKIVDYATYREVIHRIRYQVFVEEQQVPPDLELDDWDAVSTHALAWQETTPVGTGRLLPDGHIGRVAVLPALRGRGVGKAIMACLIQAAQAGGYARVELSAQCHAQPFYTKLGFQPEGSVYSEAGIDHIKMSLSLSQPLEQPPSQLT